MNSQVIGKMSVYSCNHEIISGEQWSGARWILGKYMFHVLLSFANTL